MKSEMHKMFSNFFISKSELDLSSGQPNSLPGWFEKHRVDAFKEIPDKNAILKEGSLWKLIDGKVYMVENFYLTAVLACYSDGTILWLDDHSSNSDFIDFLVRERILNWFPHQKSQFVSLLLETKFNFLGKPRLLHSISDVPVKKTTNTESKRRMAQVAERIFHPIWSQNSDGSLKLQFCVWTLMLGKIFTIDCNLGPEYNFSYAGELLVDSAGDYFFPR